MLTLTQMRNLRITRNLRRGQLADMTAIDPDRLSEIEKQKAEPWFDEAILLHRALCTQGITTLMTSGTLTTCDLGPPFAQDVDVWRSGLRVPLSVAARLTLRFGLTDPAELAPTALTRQIWAVVGTNERHPAMQSRGFCPWCQVDVVCGGKHLPTCLPNNLWGSNADVNLTELPPGLMRTKRSGKRSYGMPAHGLKVLRIMAGLTQKDVQERCGVNSNHYSRIERGDLNLTPQTADKLAALFGVDSARLYVRPEDPGLPAPLTGKSPISTIPFDGTLAAASLENV